MPYSFSIISLIAANLVPLFGVLFLQWNIGSVLLSYWIESAIIGVYNVLKMWKAEEWVPLIFKLPQIGFFILHYGLFTALLGVVYIRFALALMQLSAPLAEFPIKEILISGLALFTSHGVSYYKNFIGKKEFKRVRASDLFAQPYRRIVVMHSTIVFGVVISMLLNLEPTVGFAAVFVLLKVVVDAGAHISERHRFGSLPFPPGGLYADLHGNRR